MFQKIHDILLSLPAPVVDNLKLRERLPVVIKIHEQVLKAVVNAIPENMLKVDKNMALMILPVIVIISA